MLKIQLPKKKSAAAFGHNSCDARLFPMDVRQFDR
jgi:hypothetical protein